MSMNFDAPVKYNLDVSAFIKENLRTELLYSYEVINMRGSFFSPLSAEIYNIIWDEHYSGVVQRW
jgi:hypothetical protein